jgi:hypothetical protein
MMLELMFNPAGLVNSLAVFRAIALFVAGVAVERVPYTLNISQEPLN